MSGTYLPGFSWFQHTQHTEQWFQVFSVANKSLQTVPYEHIWHIIKFTLEWEVNIHHAVIQK